MTVVRSHRSGWDLRQAAFLAALGSVLLCFGVSQVEAQTPAEGQPFSLSAQAGVAFVGGEFGKYVGSGPSASIRLAYAIRGSTAWFAEAGLDKFGGNEIVHHTVTGPDIRALRFAVGVEQDLVPVDLEGFESLSLRVRLGAGVTSLESDGFGAGDAVFSTTSPTAVAGLTLGYEISESVALVIDCGLHWSFVKEDQTTELAALAPTFVHPFETTGTFPYGVGLSFKF